tara:strand:- start:3102 stop:3740 length:639 start_codon:yes stop_codon:yes gene_type:complete
MKKILSIDIDYMMSPAIHIYDDWVDGHWVNATVQWEMINRKMGFIPGSCVKRENYLLRIFERALKNLDDPSQVVFRKNHHEILDTIGNCNDLVIDNVDHHHDIFYSGWNSPQSLNEGNWVWWLDREERVEKYRWFGNKNSEVYDKSMPFHCEYRQVFDRRYLPMSDPDFIFVCESPHWVPPECRVLFRKMQSHADIYFKGQELKNENNAKTS